MTFVESDPDMNYPRYRMVSTGGKWEMGVYPVLFGARVRMGKVGEFTVCADICCGNDHRLMAEVMLFVRVSLAEYSEDSTEDQLRKLFPYPTVKPVHNDPFYSVKLKELRERIHGSEN